MGQAKERGTFEQRQLRAQQRNISLQSEIEKSSSMKRFVKRHGTQRLITKLVMAGAFIGAKR